MAKKIKGVQRPIGIDLFAGAGGLSLGFQLAGFEVAAAVEFDPIHAAIHEYNFPECATICESVASLSGDEIRQRAGLGSREVDVIFGGAPCQGFSLIGKRAMDDPRNQLVHHFVRIVEEINPKYFVFENVKGLTVGEHKKFLEEIIEGFRHIGYQVVEDYKVLNASDFGVPQDRKRLFLLGARRDCNLPQYPKATHERSGVKTATGLLKSTPTVWDAIGDLPEADDFDELFHRDWVRTRFKEPSGYSIGLRQKPDDEGCEQLSSSMRTVHSTLSQKRFSQTPFGESEAVSRFLKLDPNGLCNTLRAGTASDRGAFTSPRPIHPYRPRCITVREAARLHSYPDWFRFHATKWHGFRQVGNSVPPLLGQAVAESLLKAIGQNPGGKRDLIKGDLRLVTMNMREASSYFGVPSDTIPQRNRKNSKNAQYA